MSLLKWCKKHKHKFSQSQRNLLKSLEPQFPLITLETSQELTSTSITLEQLGLLDIVASDSEAICLQMTEDGWFMLKVLEEHGIESVEMRHSQNVQYGSTTVH